MVLLTVLMITCFYDTNSSKTCRDRVHNHICFLHGGTDLLANAFRTSSTKAPDSLPAVKKWKAFAKDIELLKRALAKKDGEKVLSAYKSAEDKLEAYLEEVELPSSMELKQM